MSGLETKRLRLRMFTMNDVDALAPIFGDAEVVKHLGTGEPVAREETRLALETILRHWEQHGFGRWAAVYKPTRRLIGYGGLRSFDGQPELVYLLAKPYWGRGLATEMAQACLRFGFERRKFKRIIALTKVANAASRRVLEKIGMRFEETVNISGMDVVRYSISRAAYISAQTKSRRKRRFKNLLSINDALPAIVSEETRGS